MFGLSCACLGVLICLIYYLTIDYLINNEYIKSRSLETDLVTVNHFTVNGNIRKKDYQEFEIPLQAQSKPKIEHFKDHLTQVIDEKIQNWAVMMGCPLEPHELGAVDIEFSFHNYKMMKKLVKRADLLKMGKF